MPHHRRLSDRRSADHERVSLPAKFVIHTVGPVYAMGTRRAGVLASCYRNTLRLAADNGVRTIAFPAISLRRVRYPDRGSEEIAVREDEGRAARANPLRLFRHDVYSAYERALRNV